MDYYYVYDRDGNVVAEGWDKEEVIALSRGKDEQLVGEGVRTDGSRYGFFVSTAPTLLGM